MALALFVAMAGFATGSAQAYPAKICTVTVSPHHVVGGHPITVSGTANMSVDWSASFQRQHATGKGTSFRHVFSTKKVTRATRATVVVQCSGGPTQRVVITIDPKHQGGGGNGGGNGNGSGSGSGSGGGGGILPNTGGPEFWLLMLALALVAVGAEEMYRHRRRRER